jgi:hypothetical protein
MAKANTSAPADEPAMPMHDSSSSNSMQQAGPPMVMHAATPIAKTGQPLAKGSKVTLECEVSDVLQGEFVEVQFDGGKFMVKASALTAP